MDQKIQAHHCEKSAYIYVRQSTIAQVRFHQESTERQYALKDRAVQLGWDPDKIRILDGDLGLSGSQSANRRDFKTLVSDVSLGRVGGIFCLEASRLARSSVDWQRLIELCALTQALVIDEDGCYDPAEFNDGLLLGIKGTIAQAELHIIRARLLGGKLNKARRGELRFPLPVGLCYDQGKTVLDPDQEVQGCVRLVFKLFRETGSAYGVVHQFAAQKIRFPKRAFGGAWDGKLIWDRLSHSRVLGILKNPSYAGAYVFGRYQSSKHILENGEIRTRLAPTPMESWRVLIRDHHEGYITWEEYQKNLQLISGNQTNGDQTRLGGPAREGYALLQGLLLCSKCGRKLTVRYTGNGGFYPIYECNWKKRDGRSKKSCMTFACKVTDEPISRRVLQIVKPHQLQLALKTLEVLEQRDHGLTKQWKLRVDRAEYEAQLAERRYEEVDPSHRIVASTLEQRWNDSLLRLQEAREELKEAKKQHARIPTESQKTHILSLAKDFPRLWNAKTTCPKDRKRMLRLLIKDITVERKQDQKAIILHIRWQGGANEDLSAQVPPNAADKLRYPLEIVQRIRELAQSQGDQAIADSLESEGKIPAKAPAFTPSVIRWIRHKHKIPAPSFKQPGQLSVNQVAQRFGVSRNVVYYWIERGVLPARRRNKGSQYWITLNTETSRELKKWVRNSSRISAHEKTNPKTQ